MSSTSSGFDSVARRPFSITAGLGPSAVSAATGSEPSLATPRQAPDTAPSESRGPPVPAAPVARQVVQALADAGAEDLDPDRWVREDAGDLSAGERRRVAIARALLRARAGAVDLLLLDEPTAGLDADREDQVLRAVRGLGVATLVVAHHRGVLDAVDRVVDLGAAR